MSFKMITKTDPETEVSKEYAEESVTTTQTTKKIWTTAQLEREIISLDQEITELQARKATLAGQLTKFTKEMTKE